MKRFYILGFLALLSFETLTQISSKYASIFAEPLTLDFDWAVRLLSSPWVYVSFAGYIGAFLCWMTLLRYAPVGPSFAASHLELVSVTILSAVLFNESLDLYKIIGGVLIILGVMCLAKDGDDRDKEARRMNLLAAKALKPSGESDG